MHFEIIQTISIFAKQFIKLRKRDTKDTKTNHYKLLTNVSIKRCIRPGSSGGGKSSNQTSTLQTITHVIQVINLVYQVQFTKNTTFAILLDDELR